MEFTNNKAQYDKVASQYGTYDHLPVAKIESQLIRSGLGDCTGLKILDLGGGSGVHARAALDQGAEMVDIVDISAEMLRVGAETYAKSEEKMNARWFLADASRDIWDQQERKSQAQELLQPGEYDMVMANWVFDHGDSVEGLTAMWKNVVRALKPGGRFMGIRVMEKGIWASHSLKGTYGSKFANLKGPENGIVTCDVVVMTDPPFGFKAGMVEDSYANKNEIPKAMGMVDFKVVPMEEMELVKADPEFWRELVEEPQYGVVTARKA